MNAPRSREAGLVGDVVVARVHVAEHGVAQIGAFRLDEVEHAMPMAEPAGQMDHERQAGAPLGARRADQALLLLGGEVAAHADLADQADAHARPVDPFERIPDDLVRDRIRAHLRDRGRVRALEVVAGAHHDVEAGRFADPLQRQGIAADAAAGRIDHGGAAQRLERQQLRDRELLVVEAAVVEIDERVHAQLADDAGMHRRSSRDGAARARLAGATTSAHRAEDARA